jgi:hypothetical protein
LGLQVFEKPSGRRDLIPYGSCCVKPVAVRGRRACCGLCGGLGMGVFSGVGVVAGGVFVWVEGFVQPVLGVDEVLDEPEDCAARVEVGVPRR